MLLELLSERSTLFCMKAKLPALSSGKEQYQFEVGQTCVTTQFSTIKPGFEVNIVERYTENGYCYYVTSSGQTFRQKDLSAK